MAITFGEAKARLSQFAGRGGKCPSNAEVPVFVREVLDYMLTSGAYGNQRKFVFNAINGVFTAPYELETILKAKINGEMSNVWDRWFEWYGWGDLSDGCVPSNAILEEPNYSPIVYDVPTFGVNIGVLGMNCEEESAHVIVKGVDQTGRQIMTFHEGVQIVGEYLQIVEGQIRYTECLFSRITEVYKTKTNGYVQLLWVNQQNNERGFLADYSPLETKPQYRRYRLTTRCAPCSKVEVLGYIRLKPEYSDNDLIPFENMFALSVAGQAVNSMYNTDTQNAVAKDQFMQSLIKRENDTKKVNSGRPIEIGQLTSGGSIKNIIF